MWGDGLRWGGQGGVKWVYGGWFELGWQKGNKAVGFHGVILQIIYSKREKNFFLSES